MDAGGDRRGGVSESHDRHLCSPRLHLTLYEPMKWLNHFTTDVYNAIDPYLFITPVYALGSYPRLSFLLPRLISSLLGGGKLLRPGLYPGKTNLICVVGHGAPFPIREREYGKFHLRTRVRLKLHTPMI